ncbi:MAG TPA: tetratricopeptide repeat protein [Burkholderiales bacterium]|nr:tetratricopeptide repeat protein [Burkholderiales bacterium]
MSLINKMLQDLDRRNAPSAPGGEIPPREVRAVLTSRERERWVVRALVIALIAAAVGWMAWVAFQLQLKPLATEKAMRAAQSHWQVAGPVRAPLSTAPLPRPTPAAPQVAAQQQPAPSAPAAPPAAPQVAARQQPAPSAPPAPPLDRPSTETFKLATSMAAPIQQPSAQRQTREQERPSPARPPEPMPSTARYGEAAAPAGEVQAQPANATTRVEKREHHYSPLQRAQARFRRAIVLLNEGRVSEAEDGFIAALQIEPSYQPARQALVALLLDQQRIVDAQRVLQEGLALDPKQVQFATVLARILVGRTDYDGALAVLERAAPPAKGDAEFDMLLGTVLQRLSQHAKAVEAYRAAVRAVPGNGAAWVGLGISLETLARRAEALDAYHHALATNSLSGPVRNYVEQRIQQLQ